MAYPPPPPYDEYDVANDEEMMYVPYMERVKKEMCELCTNDESVKKFVERYKALFVLRDKSFIYGVITMNGFYVLKYKKIAPVYLFDNKLDKRGLTIINKLFVDGAIPNYSICVAQAMLVDCKPDLVHARHFESVLRLIPGSYKNGAWRQLDGFFGMYFNENTLDLSVDPPPVDKLY